jgi:hypothetical protein
LTSSSSFPLPLPFPLSLSLSLLLLFIIFLLPLTWQAISGSDDRTIKFWDLDTQMCKKTIADDNIPCALKINRGHLFSGSFKHLKVQAKLFSFSLFCLYW